MSTTTDQRDALAKLLQEAISIIEEFKDSYIDDRKLRSKRPWSEDWRDDLNMWAQEHIAKTELFIKDNKI